MSLEDIRQIFVICCENKTSANFESIARIFWSVLGNSFSFTDLARIYAAVQSAQLEPSLDEIAFKQFLHQCASAKYPAARDSLKSFIDDLKVIKVLRSDRGLLLFAKLCNLSLLHCLIECESDLRLLFSSYSARGMRLSSAISWKEVVQQNLGIDLTKYMSFCVDHGVIPKRIRHQDCERVFINIAKDFPLLLSPEHAPQYLLYPQFQLLFLYTALYPISHSTESDITPDDSISKLRSFFDEIRNVSKDGIENLEHLDKSETNTISEESSPKTDLCCKPALSIIKSNKETISLRVDGHLTSILDLLKKIPNYSHSVDEAARLCSENLEIESSSRVESAVAVLDTIPSPNYLMENIATLIDNSLAYCNVGDYEEALRYLDAAKLQYKSSARSADPSQTTNEQLDFDLFLAMSKGNIYQHSGDDNQALVEFRAVLMNALDRDDQDWITISLNAIGVIAYYNCRLDVAVTCFKVAIALRLEVSLYLPCIAFF
jgi:tetratricopeptide (TPR) repeat protein